MPYLSPVKKRVRREICISSSSEDEDESSDEEVFMTGTSSGAPAVSRTSSSGTSAPATSNVDDSNLDENLKEWLNKSTPAMVKSNTDEGGAAAEGEQLVVPGLKHGVHLFQHQVQGVRWMFERETDPRRGDLGTHQLSLRMGMHGMLCDGMGLGKTMQTICLILMNRAEANQRPFQKPESMSEDEYLGIFSGRMYKRATLIVAPIVLLRQWRREINKFAPMLDVLIYYGKDKRLFTANQLVGRYDVVLTNYHTVSRQYGISRGYGPRDRNTLFDVEWHRIVLDEGHTIRNYNSTFALGCSALRAQRRWILTGTPLQNKIEELSSFFIFLDVKMLRNVSGTNERGAGRFHQAVNKRLQKNMIETKKVLHRLMLRRVKEDVLTSLPAKTHTTELLTFSPVEQACYDIIFSRAQAEASRIMQRLPQRRGRRYRHGGENEDDGNGNRGFVDILALLVRLRQCCLTQAVLPGWLRITEVLSEGAEEEAEKSAGRLEAGLARAKRWLEKLDETRRDFIKKRVVAGDFIPEKFECPICFDIAQNLSLFPCGHGCCTDHMEQLTECHMCRSNDLHPTMEAEFVHLAMGGAPSKEDLNLSDEELARVRGLVREHNSKRAAAASTSSSSSSSSGAKDISDLQDYIYSTKFEKAVELLEQTRPQAPAAPGSGAQSAESAAANMVCGKTLVFCMFTSVLHKLKDRIDDEAASTGRKYKVFMYTGQMTSEARDATLLAFEAYEEAGGVAVLLLSTTCGNAGLNLTCANTCIFMDIWWNPSIEDQAVDRTHRIGQTKPVQIYHLRVKGTVEDRIFDVQVAKRQLAADMLSKGGAKRPVVGAGLNRNDFRKIFELNEYDKQRRERIRSEKEKQRQERRRAAGLMSPDAAAVSPSVAANPDVVVALRVRPGTGAAFSPLTVEARSTHTVHQLKDQLSGRISIPAAQQQLATAMNGHLMLNHRTLASYNLVTNSEIVVGRTNVSVDAAGRAQAQRRWLEQQYGPSPGLNSYDGEALRSVVVEPVEPAVVSKNAGSPARKSMTSPRATTNRSSGGSVGANAPSTPAGAVALTPVGKSHTSAKSAVQSPAAGSSLEPKPKTAGVVQAARGPVQSTASATKPAPAAKQVPAPAPAPAPAAAQHIFLQINHADSSKFRKYKVKPTMLLRKLYKDFAKFLDVDWTTLVLKFDHDDTTRILPSLRVQEIPILLQGGESILQASVMAAPVQW